MLTDVEQSPSYVAMVGPTFCLRHHVQNFPPTFRGYIYLPVKEANLKLSFAVKFIMIFLLIIAQVQFS